MKGFLKIINGNLLTPQGILKEATLVVCDGKIREITTDRPEIENAETYDAQGNVVAPGFIDMHVHGGGGRYFLEASKEAFNIINKAHALHGTTAIFPTLQSAPMCQFAQAAEVCDALMRHPESGAQVMGLHLEGDYLNPVRCGGQDPDSLLLPDPKVYRPFLESTPSLARWSAAPELPGALEFGTFVSSKGVLVAIAHTVADYPMVKAAWEHGFSHATHFYNAMTSVHKDREFKHEGTVESIYLMDDMSVEVIGDGIHVPVPLLKLIYKIKGVERTSLVTDGMAYSAFDAQKDTGQTDSPKIIIEDGVCKLADRSALAGSIATMDVVVRTMVQKAGIPLTDAIRMASETPARRMNIADRKGSLEKGKDADIVVLSKELEVIQTFCRGERI